uniref:Uncharacterized protein n=1 Tax=Physcomitrium patens TaxID=3218 RepID=A0A2K1KNY5_PHYPA|nr:hypothetical protein PHYPA_006373 [Physcomitrium patens]
MLLESVMQWEIIERVGKSLHRNETSSDNCLGRQGKEIPGRNCCPGVHGYLPHRRVGDTS